MLPTARAHTGWRAHLCAGQYVEEAVCPQQHVQVPGGQVQRIDVRHRDDRLLLWGQAADLWEGCGGAGATRGTEHAAGTVAVKQ